MCSFVYCYSDAIADGNRCLHDVLKLVASAVSSSSCVLTTTFVKAVMIFLVSKHYSLQKLV